MAQSIKKTKPMHEADIQASIKKADYSYRKLAAELEVSATSIRDVVRNATQSHRIATHISTLINKPIDDIWPDTYNYTPRGSFKERCDNAKAVA